MSNEKEGEEQEVVIVGLKIYPILYRACPKCNEIFSKKTERCPKDDCILSNVLASKAINEPSE